jgi:hypothetical protein
VDYLTITCIACGATLPIALEDMPVFKYDNITLRHMWHISIIEDDSYGIPLSLLQFMWFLNKECGVRTAEQFIELLHNTIFKDNSSLIGEALYYYSEEAYSQLITLFHLLAIYDNIANEEDNDAEIVIALSELRKVCK